jgi:carotenoid cleavage dioxygenase-like enzyme
MCLGGSIPLDIEGTYFRNGHAKFEVGKVDKVMHPFDADGMISAVTIKDGQGTHLLICLLTCLLTYSPDQHYSEIDSC